MRLTKSVDFSMRILIFLAKSQAPVTMPELSSRLHISYNHLSKLIQRLRKEGLIKTIQGKSGGIFLLKNPSEIDLKMVVDLMDGPTMLSQCLGDVSACHLDAECKFKMALFNVQTKINDEMKKIKLEELL
jgi:Rrf2 family nitric oxide-sensitive transcriptional repressor